MFLKEHLPFDDFKDEFIKKNCFPNDESKTYVFRAPGEYYRCERFLKMLIKNNKCTEFIACMHGMTCHKEIYDEILIDQTFDTGKTWSGK